MVIGLLANGSVLGLISTRLPLYSFTITTLRGVFRENEVRRSYAWTPISLLWCRISNGYSSTSTSSENTFFPYIR